MSVRQRAAGAVQRRSVQRVCIAAAIIAAGSTAASIEANAHDSPTADERASSPEVRRIAITPADRVERVAEAEPIEELAAALVARYERLAVAPTPPDEPGEQAPSSTDAAEFGAETDDGSATDAAAPTTTHVPLETWEAVARCESGYGGEPDWSIDTGNGYYGGLQFNLDSWRWVGGTGYPHQASKATQIEMAERLWERQGWNAWPACSRKLGLR